MDMERINTAGIDSLRGFSYQIKVFVWSLAGIKSGERVEYETIDDVNIQAINPYVTQISYFDNDREINALQEDADRIQISIINGLEEMD